MADPTEEEAKRYDRDITALRDAVAAIVLAWAAVENSMVALLTAILNVPNFRIPAALYFSLSARPEIIESTFDRVRYGLTT